MRRSRFLMLFSAVTLAAGCGDDDGPTYRRPRPGDPNFAAVGTPSGLAASAASASEIDLAWKPIGGQLDGLELWRSTTGSTDGFVLLASPAASATSFADTRLSPATNYCYELRASRIIGRKEQYSPYSNVACATTAAPAVRTPVGVNATPASSSRVDVTWIDSSSNESAFRVEFATDGSPTWQRLATLAANTVAFADTGRYAEHQVCYRLIAIANTVESPPSSSDCTTPPATPIGIAAVAADAQSITLTWVDASNVEDGFAITRWPNGDQTREAQVAEVGANVMSYLDPGLQTGVSYSYRVRARKDGGYGSYSDVASAIPHQLVPPPIAPSNLVASINGMSTSITWQDNSCDEDGFILETLQSPTYLWRAGGTLPPNTTSLHFDTYTTAEQPIEYRVSAFNKDGKSTSNIDTAWVLSAPMNVAATKVDDHTIDVTWTNNSR